MELNVLMSEYAKPLIESLDFTSMVESETVLKELASAFFLDYPESLGFISGTIHDKEKASIESEKTFNLEARYRTLLEQIPAVVFMGSLEKGTSEAYVSPHLETMLGFTQQEWLGDPVLWYKQIHPEDKGRWSVEAAEMFISGKPLRSVYRVIARDGHVVWFHCEAKMVRSEDGRPWFIHGVGFDITDLKETEKALKKAHDELTQVNINLIAEVAERKRAEEAAQEYAEHLKVLSRRLMEVQETERRNISQQLHGDINQILEQLKLVLETSASLPANEVGNNVNQAQKLVNDLLTRTRKMSLDLRPAMLDEQGLLPALSWYFEQYTLKTKVNVAFKHIGLDRRRFATEMETAVYRTVQEALTNIALHSSVSEASVRVWSTRQILALQIDDQGTGFDSAAVLAKRSTGGLATMRERATLMGGKMTIESSLGKGTRVSCEWNIEGEPQARA
jgi:PAS domain S-box-containing protein